MGYDQRSCEDMYVGWKRWLRAVPQCRQRWSSVAVEGRRKGGEVSGQRREVFEKESTNKGRGRGKVREGLRMNSKRAASMVLYKDDDILAINKPAGLAVHGGPGVTESVSSYLPLWQFEQSEPPDLAHRLDRDTSGVLLLTRHTTAARKIAHLFHQHKIIKKYWAITIGVPETMEGEIRVPLTVRNIATGRSGSHQMHRVVLWTDVNSLTSEGGRKLRLPNRVQPALTRYRVLDVSGTKCSLLEVEPVTGLKHQLRVHLADGLKTPVLGDYKFAGPQLRSSKPLMKRFKSMEWIKGSVYLHAHLLEIPGYQPGGKALVVHASPPERFRKTVQMLRLKLPA